MAKLEAKILCETPTPGKEGTRIPKWKYDVVHAAIRKVVPRTKEGIEFGELPGLVQQTLSAENRERLEAL